MNKKEGSYKTISEVAEILGLKDIKKGTLSTHTIRFWEKEFSQIKPLILKGNRRYFDSNSIELLKKIKFLLKDQGMTIRGAKKILKLKGPLKLDELSNNSIKVTNVKKKIIEFIKINKRYKKFKIKWQKKLI